MTTKTRHLAALRPVSDNRIAAAKEAVERTVARLGLRIQKLSLEGGDCGQSELQFELRSDFTPDIEHLLAELRAAGVTYTFADEVAPQCLLVILSA